MNLASPSLRRCAAAAAAALMLGLSTASADDISASLESIRAKNEVPALAAAAIQDGKIVAIGATGLRRLGGKKQVTIEDQWHLGSCTKSMTASLAAMLVERGKIGWDTTVGASLAKLQPGMAAAWKPVTLEQLLGHRAGAPGDAPPALWSEAWRQRGSVDKQRETFVKGLLALPPDPAPGTKFIYSNQGYCIASSMLTGAAGKSWEPLIREMLFDPLGLKSAGFGAAGSPDKEDQPWGHAGSGAGAKPVSPGPMADNPPAAWPAGGVHMSIGDFAKYAGWHAGCAQLLKPETFQRLHTPLAGQEYGYGWFVGKRPWGGTVLMHNGTNKSNYAVMWISPEKKFAVVAATNMGGTSAEKACDEACALLIERVLAGGK
jgi:CubicO group peptidase (beta-lactamase class C family)